MPKEIARKAPEGDESALSAWAGRMEYSGPALETARDEIGPVPA